MQKDVEEMKKKQKINLEKLYKIYKDNDFEHLKQ